MIKLKIEKERVFLIHEVKLKEIKRMGCICPGCGVDFSSVPDVGLLMIFEKSHVHSGGCCDSRDTFLSCRHCNGLQRKRCGYWIKPGEFNLLH